MMIRSIGHAVLFSAITLGSITAVSAAPGNSAGGGNSGNGTIPGHSNGLGGGDGGDHSGGAPSPEVNAMLGLALAGGTLAFLRRRRAGKAKS
ncbi:hypothetical protein ABID82_003224 [Methylobacterium sp. PvP062]|uniref:PEP-CTERM protein-sorting domain-containing protein n=1 Tax=Methylobacterium radiotolerans TaxID=31998 RepID=A0ABV2NC06_9HYPH|nr:MULTISPECIES: hypothetical protein [unclassified Methylobacterium]MBP2492741.1 hypothetical protein [Methylobacterium sp. PvP105]MBP2500887.1 hypothetical protein [Methylobacterium sp. PvP109]